MAAFRIGSRVWASRDAFVEEIDRQIKEVNPHHETMPETMARLHRERTEALRAAARAAADASIRGRFARPLSTPISAPSSKLAPADLRSHRELMACLRDLVSTLNRPLTRTTTVNLKSGPLTVTTRETRLQGSTS
jgi:hypothetical protein